jgi:excinuclease ABC subunit C
MSDDDTHRMKREAFDARELLKSLPNRAGVYRMVDAAGDTLYVGKARDLKKRVSILSETEHHPRTEAMVAQVARVEVTVTRSEGEALLLENNLIKAHQPRYSVVFATTRAIRSSV